MEYYEKRKIIYVYGSGVCEVAFLKANFIQMKNIQQLIEWAKAEREKAVKEAAWYGEDAPYVYGKHKGFAIAFSMIIQELELLLTDTGATHGKLPLRKHHVRRSVPHVGTLQL